ncbi:MAG TPA: AI-2E family transporter [Cellvibrionaceae bacterium]
MKIIIAQWVNRYLAHEEAVVVLAITGLAVLALLFLGDVIAPIVTAVVLAFLLQGVMNGLERLGLNHSISVLVSFSLLLGTIGMGFFVLLPSLWDQSLNLVQELPSMMTRAHATLIHLSRRFPQFITQDQFSRLSGAVAGDMAHLGQTLVSYSLAQFGVLLGLFVYLILVPTMAFFLLKDKTIILRWLSGFLPDERPVLARIWLEVNQQIANYVRGKCVQVIVVSAACSLSFGLLGLNYALLLGVCMGISVIIPYLGAVLVSLPVFLVGYVQWGWSDSWFYLLGTVALVHALDGNVLVPLLFSNAVKMHPLAIIIAILFFGSVLGIWGVFFAIPLATLVNAILRAWPVVKVSVELQP